MKRSKTILLGVLVLLITPACHKTLVIDEVNYAQYVESVLRPDSEGIVTDYRNSISFSITSISEEEFGGEITNEVSEIRLIRNQDGYYFITADQFKHVYVFEPKKGGLKLIQSIEISELGIDKPVLNWREPFVEIRTGNKEESHYLTEKGIVIENREEGKS